ncbi:MAG: transposase [Bradyrhizobium sp.]|nr:transposase [Bradyrhizobium sp.]
MRDELLDETLFHGLDHARARAPNRHRAEDYSTARARSSIGYRTPAAYAGTIFATGSGMPDPVANTTLESMPSTTAALISAG